MLHLFIVILPVVLKDVQVSGQVMQLDLTQALKTQVQKKQNTVSNTQLVVDNNSGFATLP
jgi:hypothetical protein